MRKTFRKIHLILGLVSGLIVFVEAITGCAWVFQEEIRELVSPAPEVDPQSGTRIGPTEARALATNIFPGQTIHGIMYGKGPEEAVNVIFYDAEPEFYASVFLNPYTGEVLGTEDYLASFFAFVLKGHLYLWLPPTLGVPLVTVGTIIFVLMLITGLILWWPKNKAARKQRLWFRWKETTRWRRKNFDLHAVFGFYVGALAFLVAYSGLVMTLAAVRSFTHTALGGEKSAEFSIPASVARAPLREDGTEPVDQLLGYLETSYPNAEQFEIHFPDSDSASIYVEVTNQRGVFYNADFRFFDQYTLEEIPSPSVYGVYEEATFSDLVLRMNYDVHVGAIGGFPTKILAFLISLLIATLPVTGTLLWIGRIRKKAKAPAKKVALPA